MLEKQSKDLQQRYDEQLAAMRKDLDAAKQRATQAQQAADQILTDYHEMGGR